MDVGAVERLLARYRFARSVTEGGGSARSEGGVGPKRTLSDHEPQVPPSSSSSFAGVEEEELERTKEEVFKRGAALARRQVDAVYATEDLLRNFQTQLLQSIQRQREVIHAAKRSHLQSSSFAAPAFVDSSSLAGWPLLAPSSRTTTTAQQRPPLPLPTASKTTTKKGPTKTRGKQHPVASSSGRTRILPQRTNATDDDFQEASSRRPPSLAPSLTPSLAPPRPPLYPNTIEVSNNPARRPQAFRTVVPQPHTGVFARNTTPEDNFLPRAPRNPLSTGATPPGATRNIQYEMESHMEMHREMLLRKTDQLTLFGEEAVSADHLDTANWNFDEDSEELLKFMNE